MQRYVPPKSKPPHVKVTQNRGVPFKKGVPRAFGAGRKKGTPNKVPGQLLEAILTACANVGYDRDVWTTDKAKKTQKADEDQRIKGLIPYLERTAELHRKEMLAVLGKIVTPEVVQLMIANKIENATTITPPETAQEIESELIKLGISVSFHGDKDYQPLPANGGRPLLIDHE